MIPQVTFPAHTQARMAAANAAKELKKPQNVQPNVVVGPPTLPGEVTGLSIGDRRAILQCETKVNIGFGTIESFVSLAKDVNLAILDHCKYRFCFR